MKILQQVNLSDMNVKKQIYVCYYSWIMWIYEDMTFCLLRLIKVNLKGKTNRVLALNIQRILNGW